PQRPCRICAPSAPPSAVTAPPAGPAVGYAVPRPAASEHRAVATTQPMTLTALRSPSALSTAAALVACAVLLGLPLARLLRRSGQGVTGRARTSGAGAPLSGLGGRAGRSTAAPAPHGEAGG